MGYWQIGLEIEKKVCDFKVPLGCLGLKAGSCVMKPQISFVE